MKWQVLSFHRSRSPSRDPPPYSQYSYGGKGIVASPISKGPVLLFGLKVLSPEPDQLPGKSNSARELPPPTPTVPPTVQAYCGVVRGIRITLAVPYSDESSRLLCVIDVSLSEEAGWG